MTRATKISILFLLVAAVANAQYVLPGGYMRMPSIAAASLVSCDGAHAGASAFDSTNNAKVTCNGTRWVYDDLWTTCTMSTTTCTATVPSGTVCICQDTAHAFAAQCAVSGTTATCTSGTSNTDAWNVQVH